MFAETPLSAISPDPTGAPSQPKRGAASETISKPFGSTDKPLGMTAKGFGTTPKSFGKRWSPSGREETSEFDRRDPQGDPTKSP